MQYIVNLHENHIFNPLNYVQHVNHILNKFTKRNCLLIIGERTSKSENVSKPCQGSIKKSRFTSNLADSYTNYMTANLTEIFMMLQTKQNTSKDILNLK